MLLFCLSCDIYKYILSVKIYVEIDKMSYLSDQILEGLKEARKRKGLSQRELSARSGVPQSHISKIESGAVDIRVSSLIVLARVLDLELELVPKKAIPAVRSIVRSSNNSEVSQAQKQLKAQVNAYQDVFKAIPLLDKVSTENLKRAQDAVDAIAKHRPSPTALRAIESSREAIEKALKSSSLYQLQRAMDELPSNRLQKAIDDLPSSKLNHSLEVDENLKKAIANTARQLTSIRNNLAHQGIENRGDLSGPAYSLEGDGDG